MGVILFVEHAKAQGLIASTLQFCRRRINCDKSEILISRDRNREDSMSLYLFDRFSTTVSNLDSRMSGLEHILHRLECHLSQSSTLSATPHPSREAEPSPSRDETILIVRWLI